MTQELSTAVALAAGSLITIMIGYIRHLVKERRRLAVENARERQAHSKTRTRRDELAEEVLAERKATLEVSKKLLTSRGKYEDSLRDLSTQWQDRQRDWQQKETDLSVYILEKNHPA